MKGFLISQIIFLGLHATARDLPSFPAHLILDETGTLSSQQIQSVSQRLDQIYKTHSIQFAVAFLNQMEGEDIEGFANRLFRHWKLGDAKKNDGLLLVVAPDIRRFRIEVGYGLEGTLPDARMSQLSREYLVPKFKAGDYGGGVLDFAEAVQKYLDAPTPEVFENRFGVWPVVIVWSLLLSFLVFVAWANRRFSAMKYRGGRWSRSWDYSSPSGWGDQSSGGFWGSGGGGFGGQKPGGGSSGGGGFSGRW
ncbi:MAG: TPM domain-containing protein [Oligoflexia bacterium]|nr:TPM domain-containing protein [Oligoflexia bacterium]